MEDKLLDLLADLCEDDCVKDDLDAELFESGLLDSLAVAELILGIEEATGVSIAPSEVAREDFDTPRKILSLVSERLA